MERAEWELQRGPEDERRQRCVPRKRRPQPGVGDRGAGDGRKRAPTDGAPQPLLAVVGLLRACGHDGCRERGACMRRGRVGNTQQQGHAGCCSRATRPQHRRRRQHRPASTMMVTGAANASAATTTASSGAKPALATAAMQSLSSTDAARVRQRRARWRRDVSASPLHSEPAGKLTSGRAQPMMPICFVNRRGRRRAVW